MKIYNNHTRYTKYTKYKQKTFVIAFSGGNDSSRVLQLFYEMLANLPKNEQR
ncbi:MULTISPECIES: hypothetical protein [unclassified Campylobacter]|uniref:hypothetical protein n=1 Tax=unclassified Campylobacter TaxID=2593542 RepID=UPI001680AE00|nr:MULTISPECIES: hypothetical protein [unclassified Campylobacter]